MIYLDNSATTKPCTTAVNRINNALNECWGNPSSLYGFGLDAENEVTAAREKAAALLGADEKEIYFTGCGTESNNIALQGAANALKKRGNRIITTSVEHPSVLNTVAYLEKNGFEVIRVKPRKGGMIEAEDVLKFVDGSTVLVSVMLVNNETGRIFPVKEIAAGLKKLSDKAVMHSDCVQAFGKLPIKVSDLGVGLLSASGHKIHGPKGIGILYKSKNVNIVPVTYGGGQEKNLRPGTESVPLIAGLKGAMDELDIGGAYKTVSVLNNYAREVLSNTEGVVINTPADGSLPYIINISVPGYRSETLLHGLEARGIFVSSGSACSKGKGSYVLIESGFDKETVDSALRISFSRDNTTCDIDGLCTAITEIRASTRKRKF